ncbi:hypothetical protein MMPV_005465 [Pyropia vietnamensis]
MEPAVAVPPSPTEAAPMRVTAVRLFSNGMAHLEAEATVVGDATLTIPVRTGAMSDVLKSLSVADMSGGDGSIASVGYESPAGGVDADGAAAALDLSPTQSLLRLLREVQGASVVLTTGGGVLTTVAGKLMGTQAVSPLLPRKMPLPRSSSPDASSVRPDIDDLGPFGMVEPLDVDAIDGSTRPGFPLHVAVLVLTAAGKLITVPLVFVTNFHFADPTLTAALSDILDGRAAAVTVERKLLYIRCVGTGERRIVARWCVEAPVWKTTYRLFMGGDDNDTVGAPVCDSGDGSTGADSSPPHSTPPPPPPPLVIQGWAIIDNGFEMDLTDVRLSLLSGMAVSFKTSLFERRFKARVTEPTGDETPATGRVSEANALFGAVANVPRGIERRGFAAKSSSRPRTQPAVALAPAFASTAVFGGRPPPENEASEEEPKLSVADDGGWIDGDGALQGGPPPAVGGSADGIAATTNLTTAHRPAGDHFSYTVDAPVSVPRRQSAMVPILATPVTGSRVALYRSSIRRANPLLAILFTNTSGATLEGGPVTVLHNELLAGEAMLRSCRPGDVQLLPYAVDLDVDAEEVLASRKPPPGRSAERIGLPGIRDSDEVHELKLANGLLLVKAYRLRQVSYTFTSRRGRQVVLYVDHPKQGGGYVLHTADVRAGRHGAAAAAARPPASPPAAATADTHDGGDDSPAGAALAGAPMSLKPTEEDASSYRFRLTLPAATPGCRSVTSLTVTERAERRSRVQLTSLSDDAVAACVAGRLLSEDAAATLSALVAVRGRLTDAQQSVAALEADSTEEAAMQERLRANLAALGGSAPSTAEAALRARYVTALSDSEDAVGRLREERRRRLAAVASAKQALADAVAEACF